MKQEKGYSVYTMLHIAISLNKIDKDDSIDVQWEIAESLYADYEKSKYNQGGMSEYDCIVNYLKGRELKHKLLASKFIAWYFNDHDEVKMLGTSMLHQLTNTGQCSLSVQELFDNCGYIPKYICEDDYSIYEYSTDYEIESVELINDFK